MNERPVPAAALEDENSVEMLRVWIASRAIHCSMKVGMYKGTSNVAEDTAWGVILADVARHIASALQSGYGMDEESVLSAIKNRFNEEIGDPTSDLKGGFVKQH